jgi:predicted enzyme related to lactoylglutathione lyase
VPTPLAGVVIDCAQPRHLAAFWTEVTGYRIAESEDDWVMLVPPDGGVTIGLQKVPEPKLGKNRVHVDVLAQDVEVEAARIERLGGRRLWTSGDPADVFIVLADPEGNEFCVIERHADPA